MYRDELTRNYLNKTYSILQVIEIEERIQQILKENAFSTDESQSIINTGGLKACCFSFKEHIESRIYQHTLGILIDISTNYDPDRKNYHKENLESLIKQYNESTINLNDKELIRTNTDIINKILLDIEKQEVNSEALWYTIYCELKKLKRINIQYRVDHS